MKENEPTSRLRPKRRQVVALQKKMIRTFIAIELPELIKTILGEIQKELRKTGAHISWTKPANIHLTLKFLGDLDEKRVELLLQTTCQSVAEAKPFVLTTGDLGFFPNQKRPRVMWIGLGGDIPAITDLQEKLDRDLAAVGFPADDKPFSPHLTIGRFRTSKNINSLCNKISEIDFGAIQFVVDHITVMRSQLDPAGAIYTPLEKCPLSSFDRNTVQ